MEQEKRNGQVEISILLRGQEATMPNKGQKLLGTRAPPRWG